MVKTPNLPQIMRFALPMEVSVSRSDKTMAEFGAAIDEPLVLEFDNNRLLPELYGEHGKHLARIEQTLDVSLANRGNRFLSARPVFARAEQVCSAFTSICSAAQR